jgi:hypothetical protein
MCGQVLGAYATSQSATLPADMTLSGTLGGLIGSVSALESAGLMHVVGGVTTALLLPRVLRISASTTALTR